MIFTLPLFLGGCFLKPNKDVSPEPKETETVYNVYLQNAVLQGGYKVEHPADWPVEETTTNKFPKFNDITTFTVSANETIKVMIFKVAEEDSILSSYNIESESQTQIDGRLANDYLVQDLQNNNQRLKMISVINGDYIYVLVSSNPGSLAFDQFINKFIFLAYAPPPVPPQSFGNEVTFKLYFDNLNKDNGDCLPDGYQQVTALRPTVEIGLIPLAINALIQASAAEDLAGQNLSSAVPINTRLLSFGYENNTAIVNFNDELNSGGGSCTMAMRRGQIESTLRALNEVSNLRIRDIEIQVNGETETALQP